MIGGVISATLGACPAIPALAHEKGKIGLVLPMSGPLSGLGKQSEVGARLYMMQHGDSVAGRKVEWILKDDTGTPDISRRLAQELVVNDNSNGGQIPFKTPMPAAPVASVTAMPRLIGCPSMGLSW